MKAVDFLKGKKNEACASLGIKTAQFGNWLKSASAEEIENLASELGFVASATEDETEDSPEFELNLSVPKEVFIAKNNTPVSFGRFAIARISPTSRGELMIVCDMEGVGEVIVERAGRIQALIRELGSVDELIGYPLPIILSGDLALKPTNKTFNGVAQFRGVALEQADDNLNAWVQSRRERKAKFAMLTRAQQQEVIERDRKEGADKYLKQTEQAKANVLSLFRKS